MGDFLGLTGLEARDLLSLVLALPYLFIVTGRLVPYRQVRDWKDLYHQSEAARERALLALGRTADAIDASNQVVSAALSPPDEVVRRDAT